MSSASRRSFLALAGAGAAGVGLSTAVGGIAGSAGIALGEAAPAPVPTSLAGSLSVFVEDVHGDEVSLMIGDDEVIVRDSSLVARLAGAATKSRISAAI